MPPEQIYVHLRQLFYFSRERHQSNFLFFTRVSSEQKVQRTIESALGTDGAVESFPARALLTTLATG